LPNRLPGVNAESIKSGFDKMAHEIEGFDAFYVLDANGVQIGDAVSLNEKYKAEDDNPTIGLVLCSEKSEAVARYSVLADQKQLFAIKYLPYLPSEEELQAILAQQRAEAMKQLIEKE